MTYLTHPLFSELNLMSEMKHVGVQGKLLTIGGGKTFNPEA